MSSNHSPFDQEQGTPEGKSSSSADKLIIRLEHLVRHNLEHAVMLEQMALAAERHSGLETARLIRAARENVFLQNRSLEKALSILRLGQEQRA